MSFIKELMLALEQKGDLGTVLPESTQHYCMIRTGAAEKETMTSPNQWLKMNGEVVHVRFRTRGESVEK
jgi:hypothetical protein